MHWTQYNWKHIQSLQFERHWETKPAFLWYPDSEISSKPRKVEAGGGCRWHNRIKLLTLFEQKLGFKLVAMCRSGGFGNEVERVSKGWDCILHCGEGGYSQHCNLAHAFLSWIHAVFIFFSFFFFFPRKIAQMVKMTSLFYGPMTCLITFWTWITYNVPFWTSRLNLLDWA